MKCDKFINETAFDNKYEKLRIGITLKIKFYRIEIPVVRDQSHSGDYYGVPFPILQI